MSPSIPRETYRARRAALSAALREAGLSCAVFRDEEGRRDMALRYFTGLPGDGVLILTADGRSVLAAWDHILAARMADADRVLPFTDYGRTLKGALTRLLPELGIQNGSGAELPAGIPHVEFLEIERALPETAFISDSPSGAAATARSMRSVKDKAELALYRRAAELTDILAEEIGAAVAGEAVRSEADVALHVERRSRELGCEGPGFETLCAGPGRSWGIHAFPAWTSGPFGDKGLSILDFGLKLEGYVTDVTLTVARGPLPAEAEKMIALVEEAYAAGKALLKPGVAVAESVRAVNGIFSREGFTMPHALGHSIGLEAHEQPVLRDRPDNDWSFAEGMVIAMEPGLYHPQAGGVRLENDFIITAEGAEALTHSRIIRL
jgi:Xaa-Pro dipeptidase